MMNKLYLFLALVFTFSLLSAQSVEGEWKTIDDETGATESIVKMYVDKGKLYGQIQKLLPIDGKPRKDICTTCTGEHKDERFAGMVIIKKLKQNDNEWEGDKALYYPKDDKYYDCKVWLDKNDPDILYIRGYWGFLYRTQVWHRVKSLD